MTTESLYRLSLFVSVILICNTELLSQWKSGYLITTELDTLYGEIKSEHKFALSDRINFRSLKEVERTYYPDEIKLFDAPGIGHYVSGQLQLKGDDLMSSQFFEVLVEGDPSLLKLNHDFNVEDGPESKGVKEWFLMKNVGDVILVIEPKKYITQITEYVFPCSEVSDRVKAGNYKVSDRKLAELTIDYNECLNNPYTSYISLPQEDGICAFVGVGALNPDLQPNQRYFPYRDLNKTSERGAYVIAGMGIPLFSWLDIEMAFDYRSMIEDYTNTIQVTDNFSNAGELLEQKGRFELNFASIRAGLALKYPVLDKLRIHGGAGILAGVGLRNEFHRQQTTTISGTDGLTLVLYDPAPSSASISARELGTYLKCSVDYQLGRLRIGPSITWINARNNQKKESLNFIAHDDLLIGLEFRIPMFKKIG